MPWATSMRGPSRVPRAVRNASQAARPPPRGAACLPPRPASSCRMNPTTHDWLPACKSPHHTFFLRGPNAPRLYPIRTTPFRPVSPVPHPNNTLQALFSCPPPNNLSAPFSPALHTSCPYLLWHTLGLISSPLLACPAPAPLPADPSYPDFRKLNPAVQQRSIARFRCRCKKRCSCEARQSCQAAGVAAGHWL